MRLVIVESPFRGADAAETARNIRYARACMRDCLLRGEAPYASHLLYTQPGVLDDGHPEERKHGIEAGFAWRRSATATVVYTDLGISDGMKYGIKDAASAGRGHVIEYRQLGPNWDKEPIRQTTWPGL